MYFVESKWFFEFFASKWVRGIAIFPFIIYKNAHLRSNKTFINHEKIHIRQQAELLITPFFLWYVIEFMIRLIQYKDADKAYRNISFEREAYANEDKLEYLKSRKLWSFWQYI